MNADAKVLALHFVCCFLFCQKSRSRIYLIAKIMLKLELSQPSFLTATFAIKVLIWHFENLVDLLALASSKLFSLS